MSNKNALIIGVGGIGLEIAKKFASNNYNLYLSYYGTDENIVALKNDYPDSIKYYNYLNLKEEDSINKYFSEIKDLGKIDTVIFCATSKIEYKLFFDKSWDDFDSHISVQIKGFYEILSKLSQHIKTNIGIKFVVILSEVCVGTPTTRLADYITAKYGLMGFAKALSQELAPYNCRVNMISPGMTDTSLISNIPEKLIEITKLKNPLKRIAKPQDVANVALFLCSDEADYLNGVNITVNGGSIIY